MAVAVKTGNGDSWQPMTGADPARIRELGALLRLRRVALGYRYVPSFLRDRDINIRMVGDIEHGRRDTFTFPSLEDAAGAYEVTYDSMLAVVWSGAGELVPVPPAAIEPEPEPPVPPAAPQDDGWEPPVGGAGRRAAARPYAARIYRRLLDLAAQGITDPDGERVFGPGADAKTWDGTAGRWDLDDRVLMIADMQRRDDGRDRGTDTGMNGRP